MSTLIIIRGNSGSGKTSVAKALQRKLGRNTLLISQDVVRRDMLWVRDGQNTDALPLLLALLHYGQKHCPYVILEGILRADWYLPLFSTAKKLFSPRIFAYYYDLSFEETLRRHATKPNHLDFGETEMRRWWTEKDWIATIPETIFTDKTSFEEALNQILQNIAPVC